MEQKIEIGKQLLEQNFIFQIGEPPKEIMRLDEEGMIYNGIRIKDAGEAYRTFMEVMSKFEEQNR